MKKILVTPRSFGKFNRSSVEKKLNDAGIEIVYNPYNRIMTKEEMISTLKGMDGLIVGVDPVDEEVLEAAGTLKAIAKYGVGTDNIDLDASRKLNIPVSTTKNANSNAVADYSFGMMAAVARNIVRINNSAKNGDWTKQTAIDIYKKKIGIIGLGAIGKGMVNRCKGFDMEIYAYDVYKDENYIKENNIKFTAVDEMLKECDFITLHIPLTDETKHIINENNLKNCKKNLVIVNTARGGLIDEKALYDALKTNRIYGAAIDAFEIEPPRNSPLLELDNVIVGSHTAAGSEDATNMMTEMAVENIIRDLGGK
ncbi:phosphoglycerate dehydrogenase [Erysipelothrix urinaevulpis]|uniref:phosphoglycerate dehydrogenase n=1 Tax=Erysipelothrix urinaevulpis TaxID=2683717 RepID=UPI001358F129|nr:phosphoglycerate dehydrogenase [Erysipelothrix urinaevulpis]